jgi:hypothetical protein
MGSPTLKGRRKEMKIIIRVALALTLALALLVVSTETAQAATTTPVSEVKGVIVDIDKTATPPDITATITIKPQFGASLVLEVDNNTLITNTVLGSISFNDLAINDQATADYNADTNIASTITVIQPMGKRYSFEGTIKSKSGTNLVVTTNKVNETFKVSSVTQYQVPSLKNATLNNFSVGDKVNLSTVEITTAGKTIQIAQSMTYVPVKSIKFVFNGTITAYKAKTSITIKDTKGASTTFIINSSTKISLSKGITKVSVSDQAKVTAQFNTPKSQFTAAIIAVSGAKVVKSTQTTK